ncbi:MAG: endonuclease [Deltaproteobacteria bacterium CG_4_10_14_0_2_um_filter_43_8]|nr:MAG: endonuclease [Deltaproteobacteria bacterium CG11_big_fil_rev_8_21_14_0_20_42_23]PJA21229.1 MAG: endonuclease [Deltaproteobacteria bacterium CG_4_10_14_0_2_um_filter_43_8]PJC64833.1 MAG: endonuclease [Deltaproteobacteria bacterium CG_4_9_14_0_2_um_filter_42_21]
MLEALNGNFYTGFTVDLEERLKAHKTGKGAKFTRAFGVKQLVYQEKLNSKSKAMKREAEIKRLTRNEKELLVQPHLLRL